MKKTNKNSSIALLLILAIATTLFTLPSANVSAKNYDNPAYISASPSLVGVGQTVTVLFFLANPTPTATAGFNPATNWNGFMVDVTSPSGKLEKFGPYTSDATGGAFFVYSPSEIGQYKLDFTFPGQTVAGNYYNPKSATANLTVQQEPIKGYQTPQLPSNYWSRPIYGENRGWSDIGGNWLRTTYNNTEAFNPYTTAPNTGHIVWTRQQYIGGVIGGDYGNLNYYQAPTYQSYWVPPIIINGRLYYMQREVPGNSWAGLHCVDIRTGNELWYQDVSTIGQIGAGGGANPINLYGQVFDAEGVNGHGAQAFIWNLGANWTCFDANSGKLVYTVINPLAAIGAVVGPELLIGGADPAGSIIAFYADGVHHWLVKWNSTQLLVNYFGGTSTNLYSPPFGAMIDWKMGIQWNVTNLPDRGTYICRPGREPPCDGNVVFECTADILIPVDNFNLTAYSAKDGHELWYSSFSDIFVPGSTTYEMWGPVYNGVLTVFIKDAMQWYGYDEYTGQKIWGPISYTNAWDTYTACGAGYGNLYVGTYAGKIYCHDIKTGNLKWTYTLPPGGYETPYGTYPVATTFTDGAFHGITVADGKIYAITGEHTPNSPYWLGSAMYCVNATTGDLIYVTPGWWSSYPAIADGYALNHNCYDGTIYSFGKGQTEVTVSAPYTDLSLGQGLTIKGTVVDESPGTLDYAGNRLNTKGTPAIADASMTQWMEYLYQQKPMPTNATGVPVVISVIDANNNNRVIGTTTSSTDGFFSFNWKPDIVGNYTLTASFQGSESYYPSHAVTAFTVVPAPVAAAQPTTQPLSVMESYFVPAVIGIIVAIFIVGAVLALLILRKRA